MENFSVSEVKDWLKENNFDEYIDEFEKQKIDGKVLLTLTETDLKNYLNFKILGDIRKLISIIKKKQKPNLSIFTNENLMFEEFDDQQTSPIATPKKFRSNPISPNILTPKPTSPLNLKIQSLYNEPGVWDPSHEESWGSSFTKFFVSLMFTAFTIFLTAITMVIAHERVPNPTTYPPLPDFILDNIERIPIAFELAEVCILSLTIILLVVLIFHKHRMIIVRRMCVIIGVVFLLRCLTMFITSLSVPGKHLTNCANAEILSIDQKLLKAWKITKGLGLSISGVYTWYVN